MNILVVTNIYPNISHPYYGVFVKNQVDLYRYSFPNDCIRVLRINPRKGGGSRLGYLAAVFKLVHARLAGKYDVVHCHHAFCVFLARIAFYKKIVYTHHEGEYFRSSVVERIKLIAVRMATRVIFVNPQMQIDMDPRLTKHSRFLPCGVAHKYFLNHKAPQAGLRVEMGLPLDVPIIFFPANPARKEKNYPYLIEALQTWDCLNRGPRPLVLAGGDIPYAEIWKWYRACDVVVSCSLFESDGMVYKEAMYCGRRFLSPPVGNAARYANDGEFGLIYEPGSFDDFRKKLVELIEHSKEEPLLAKQMTSERTEAKILREIYNECLVA